jgi:uncharacterized protein (TIGR03000 family)
MDNVTYETPQLATGNTAGAPGLVDLLAHVRVQVPAEAKVWIDGTDTTSTGPVREFNSPPLTPGKQYSYDIKATWNENGHDVTQTQHVKVSAGAHANVAFPIMPKTAAQTSAATQG